MLNHERRLTSLARRHLPPAVAEQWLDLMRPALRLRSRVRGRFVGKLGGLPALPEGLAWPQLEDGRSLHFVASIECGRLPADQLDIALPDRGRLYFFHFHAERRDHGDWEERLATTARSARAVASASRVIYVPDGVRLTRHEPPEDIDAYLEVPLEADVVATGPCLDHPAFTAAVERLSAADRAYMADWDSIDSFRDAMDEGTSHNHRIGGHADPVQSAVEMEVASSRVDEPYGSAAMSEEARRWTLLAQIDSDDEADMQRGDVGTLYWLIRPQDLAAGRFDGVSFVSQCS